MALKVAIVGRPNVGKSTLFNRLVGKRLALVDDRPGVTRDRRYADGNIGDMDLTLIDTAVSCAVSMCASSVNSYGLTPHVAPALANSTAANHSSCRPSGRNVCTQMSSPRRTISTASQNL